MLRRVSRSSFATLFGESFYLRKLIETCISFKEWKLLNYDIYWETSYTKLSEVLVNRTIHCIAACARSTAARSRTGTRRLIMAPVVVPEERLREFADFASFYCNFDLKRVVPSATMTGWGIRNGNRAGTEDQFAEGP